MAQENEDGQEKTEDPTERKKSQARESGQMPRSKELNAILVVLVGGLCFLVFGHYLLDFVTRTATSFLQADRALISDPNAIAMLFKSSIFDFIKSIGLFLATLFIVTILSPALMGGWNLSAKALAPKFDKLNPIKGIKRIFSVQALMEMVKAFGKFILIAAIAVLVIGWQAKSLLALSNLPVETAMAESIRILNVSFLAICAGLLIIVMIDVPFQLWMYNKQLKMTKQEIKDEFKDTEGKPEVKAQIRRAQREMSQRRMMDQVAQADVVITNPTHYAVAIRYDPQNDEAPILLAKGQNLVALKIREIATDADIPILQSPPLARSIYKTTELNQQIPAGLYMAVAQVLAFVHHLNEHKKGKASKPEGMPDFPIPPELQFDQDSE